MSIKQGKKFSSKPTPTNMAAGVDTQSIPTGAVELAESIAYELALELLADRYRDGGYLAFTQAMWGLVQRYDMVVGEAESQGGDERMCRAAGAGDIGLTFVPNMMAELAKLAP